VKLPDVNLFVYAYDTLSPRHELAKQWLEDVLSGTETVALAWVALLGFVRFTTSRHMLGSPWGVEQALEVVDSWLAQPVATIVHPTNRHASVLRDLLAPLGTGGNLTTDAHLAALAIEHGATLCSHDNDFSRFPGLRWVDPLRG
jgi:toxin-antitoxin system PIN domain toxin